MTVRESVVLFATIFKISKSDIMLGISHLRDGFVTALVSSVFVAVATPAGGLSFSGTI